MKIHFWELPANRTYIKLESELKCKIYQLLITNKYSYKFRTRFRDNKISVRKILKISEELRLSLELIEESIFWIGGNNSNGISKPKLPFNFNSRIGSRFIAAIMNDGCLTKDGKDHCGRLMYDNFDPDLRKSVINDYIKIFGGNSSEVSFRNYETKKYLEFPSIARDAIFLVSRISGSKAIANLHIPEFILNSEQLMLGWIEQTIADEGEVKFDLAKYRRSIVWRRSVDVTELLKNYSFNSDVSIRKLPLEVQSILENYTCNLIEDEMKILNYLGIYFRVYNLGIYLTEKNEIRTRFQISITKRNNLIQFRKMSETPSHSRAVGLHLKV